MNKTYFKGLSWSKFFRAMFQYQIEFQNGDQEFDWIVVVCWSCQFFDSNEHFFSSIEHVVIFRWSFNGSLFD